MYDQAWWVLLYYIYTHLFWISRLFKLLLICSSLLTLYLLFAYLLLVFWVSLICLLTFKRAAIETNTCFHDLHDEGGYLLSHITGIQSVPTRCRILSQSGRQVRYRSSLAARRLVAHTGPHCLQMCHGFLWAYGCLWVLWDFPEDFGGVPVVCLSIYHDTRFFKSCFLIRLFLSLPWFSIFPCLFLWFVDDTWYILLDVCLICSLIFDFTFL